MDREEQYSSDATVENLRSDVAIRLGSDTPAGRVAEIPNEATRHPLDGLGAAFATLVADIRFEAGNLRKHGFADCGQKTLVS